MTDVPRISVEKAWEKIESGQALLVCAYEDPEKCALMRLNGAVNMNEFRLLRTSLPKDHEIIFYCA